MRIAVALLLLTLIAFSFAMPSCKSSGPATFCDTACSSDTIRFSLDHPDEPNVAIGMKNCKPDTIAWTHDGLPAKRKVEFAFLAGKEVHINKNFIRAFIKDTGYVWLAYNDCLSGQGFLAKIPFDKAGAIVRKNGALNSFDRKFAVPENLAVYTDKGNIFVEDMATGKKATMTFGRRIEDMDFNNIHESIDSLSVTPEHVWVKFKVDNEWQTLEKKITMQ